MTDIADKLRYGEVSTIQTLYQALLSNNSRYYPPDNTGTPTNFNKHTRTKTTPTVRFEMPFAIWCTTCTPHETIIGQGVRFNAEKKKVGNYYSTPIFSFRMKHTACGGWIEIRTDPKNTAYVVTEGARKRETGEDQVPAVAGLGEIALKLGREGKEGGDDPLARLEGKVVDKRRAETESSRILALQERQSRDWDDPYEKSRRLRRSFRVERKQLERTEKGTEALKDKMSLGIELVAENEEDKVRAGLVDFGGAAAPESVEDAVRATRLRPLFAVDARKEKDGKEKKHGRVRTADLLANRKAAFRHELTGNTRAAVDPFLNAVDEDAWQPEVKRRRIAKASVHAGTEKDGPDVEAQSNGRASGPQPQPQPKMKKPPEKNPAPVALVDYGSDSS